MRKRHASQYANFGSLPGLVSVDTNTQGHRWLILTICNLELGLLSDTHELNANCYQSLLS